jgi:hypothetical protein
MTNSLQLNSTFRKGGVCCYCCTLPLEKGENEAQNSGKISQNAVKIGKLSVSSPKTSLYSKGFVMTNYYAFGEVLEFVREVSLILRAN